jgi:hypothetical protein
MTHCDAMQIFPECHPKPTIQARAECCISLCSLLAYVVFQRSSQPQKERFSAREPTRPVQERLVSVNLSCLVPQPSQRTGVA